MWHYAERPIGGRSFLVLELARHLWPVAAPGEERDLSGTTYASNPLVQDCLPAFGGRRPN
jgi:hypothetical protein